MCWQSWGWCGGTEQAGVVGGDIVQPLSRLCRETREQMLVGTVPVSLEPAWTWFVKGVGGRWCEFTEMLMDNPFILRGAL